LGPGTGAGQESAGSHFSICGIILCRNKTAYIALQAGVCSSRQRKLGAKLNGGKRLVVSLERYINCCVD
jgi:hypothetical protein